MPAVGNQVGASSDVESRRQEVLRGRASVGLRGVSRGLGATRASTPHSSSRSSASHADTAPAGAAAAADQADTSVVISPRDGADDTSASEWETDCESEEDAGEASPSKDPLKRGHGQQQQQQKQQLKLPQQQQQQQQQQQRGKRDPARVLLRTLPLGLGRILGKPWFLFLVSQILVVWLVAATVTYLHDYATQVSRKQKLKSALGQQGFLDRLGERLRNRCPLTGPVCRERGSYKQALLSMDEEGEEEAEGQPKYRRKAAGGAGGDEDDAELPLLIFFAGIEGSGHKFFEQVFRNLPINFSVVEFEPDLHLTAEETQTLIKGADVRCPLLPYPRPLRAFAKEVLKRLREVGQGPYLRARDSYPLGRVRTPLARPDLFHLLQLDGHVYNLKVVVLQRGLADAVRSAYRMGYHGGDIGLQARIVEDEMAFLDTSIRLIPCGKYIALDFDWTADDPRLIAQPLAEFLDLGISAQDVVKAVEGATQSKPKHKTKYPEFGGQTIEEFFALRTDMWPLLAACRLAPYFWPHHPRDWPEQSDDATFMFERRKGYDFE